MKYVHDLIIRYLLILVPADLLYFILTPVTIYGIKILLFFWDPRIIDNMIIINGIPFTFIDACIAVYAYWLLLFLTLTTKDIRLLTRIKIISLGFMLVLAMNYFRIWLLIILTVKYGFGVFNTVHLIFWKFLSWVYVAFVWIFLVKLYKIESVPVYSDFKYLIKKVKPIKQSLFPGKR